MIGYLSILIERSESLDTDHSDSLIFFFNWGIVALQCHVSFCTTK